MNGLEQLPGPSKDRLQPMFLLAPWVSSGRIQNSIERIEKAFPNRPYFLDFDRDYKYTNIDAPAQLELKELRSSTDCYYNWCEFISQYEYLQPCIQHQEQTSSQLLDQIHRIQELGRIFCIRIELARYPDNIEEIVAALIKLGTADYVIQIDGGWPDNLMLLESEVVSLISDHLFELDARIPFIVSYTSIPKGFSEIEGIKNVSFTNRNLIKNLERSTNRTKFIYGDWGSTRPREAGMASRPLPRIDYPTENSWLFARNKDDNWNFQNAAQAIVNSSEWNESYGLGVWGEQMIEQTSKSNDLGINTPQKNVAARVNIHLHRQAFYDVDLTSVNLDEEWID